MRDRVIESLEFFDPKTACQVSTVATHDPAHLEMLAFPAGEFGMGCANHSLFDNQAGSLGCTKNAQPLHRVRLSPYSIDKSLVTYGEFSACVAASTCPPPEYPGYTQPKNDDPVRHVTWEHGRAFCSWKGKALPTEAQWERAAQSADFVIDRKEHDSIETRGRRAKQHPPSKVSWLAIQG